MLVREDNLKIIEEIRNLEKGALGDYIRKVLVPLQNDNAIFYETLYKDIHYVLRNVDEPGDNDLVNENGNWPVFNSNGEMKLTGYQTRLHDIILSLHTYKVGKAIAEKSYNFGEEIKRFEKEFLNANTYTPEYKNKLDAINSSIIKERYDNYVLPRLTPSNVKPQQVPEPIKSKEKINAPIIALFCLIINETQIIAKSENENVETYCRKVCDKFNLTYTDRVRQNFNGNKTKKNIETLSKQILPKIDSNTRNALTAHLAYKNK